MVKSVTNKDQIVDQHIREHEARLKHLDELLERAEKAIADSLEHEKVKLKAEQLKERRDELAREVEQARVDAVKNREMKEIQRSGPMGIWDAVAQDLEHLLERLKL